MDPIHALLEWAAPKGVQVRGIKPQAKPNCGIGMTASKALKKGDVLLTVPFRAARGLETIPPAIRAKLPPKMSIHSLLAAEFVLNPPAKSWRNVIPTIADFGSLPFFWPASAQKLLPSAAKRLLDNQQRSFQKDWEHFRSGYPGTPPDAYKHAWFVVNTRAFYQETQETLRYPWHDRLALLPVADLFNHAAVGCQASFSADSYEIIADRDYRIGDEICTSYGDHANDFFLAEYGFLLQDNDYDRFDPEGLLSSEPSAEEAKLVKHMKTSAVLRQVCGPPTEEEHLFDDEEWSEEDLEEADDVQVCKLLAKFLKSIDGYRRDVEKLADGKQGYKALLLQRWNEIDQLVRKGIRLPTPSYHRGQDVAANEHKARVRQSAQDSSTSHTHKPAWSYPASSYQTNEDFRPRALVGTAAARFSGSLNVGVYKNSGACYGARIFARDDHLASFGCPADLTRECTANGKDQIASAHWVVRLGKGPHRRLHLPARHAQVLPRRVLYVHGDKIWRSYFARPSALAVTLHARRSIRNVDSASLEHRVPADASDVCVSHRQLFPTSSLSATAIEKMFVSVRVLVSLALLSLATGEETGNHPDWPRWCGKVYKPEYPSFEPGGESVEPPALADPALHVQFKPRYSLYLEGEKEAEFVVNAAVSKWRGVRWPKLDTPEDAPPVVFTINLAKDNSVLVSRNVSVDTHDNLFTFNLTGLKPSMEPYEVVLFGATESGAPNVTATSELLYLPEKKTGSVTKLDNLNGGFLFRNSKTDGKFEPLLPYGFYALCDRFLCADGSKDKIKHYQDLGLTGMVSLSSVFKSRTEYEYMDSLDLKYQYDLRDYFRNVTEVERQVAAIKDFDSLYAYWGVDEPDGWQYPFEQPLSATDRVRKVDPYHPVSITLNCQNYYFKEYTEGADFIMADPYPIAINATFSKWGTPCNTTYGDCGCDNCEGNVQDVPRRLDNLAQYEQWHGLWPKTKVHNPQSFHGEDYWFRDPTPAEEVAMNALAFNHGAKSILSWVWPASDALGEIHGKFAKKVANVPVRDFIVLGKPEKVKMKCNDVLDAAYWTMGDKLLLNVVNGGYVAVNKTIKVPLPPAIQPKKLKDVVWGNGTWSIKDGQVKLASVDGMSTNMVILQL